MNEIDRKTKYNPVPADRKVEIIQDAMMRIKDESLDAIAASHGISQPTLWKWLDAVPEYKPYRDQLYVDKLYSAVSSLADTERDILESEDQLSLARARALGDIRDKVVRSAQWDLERRVKDYQPKQDQGTERVSVSFTISPPSNRDDSTHITIDSVLNRDSDEQT